MNLHVVTYGDLLAKADRRVFELTLEVDDSRRTLAGLVAAIANERGWNLATIAVAVNGVVVESGGANWDALIEDKATVVLAPRPGEYGTIALIGIALVSAAASAYLASQARVPKISGDGDGARKRYGFARFSSDAVVGDKRGVVFGRHRRYGGKVIARIPVESSDGNGDAKLLTLIALSRGSVNKIGTQTADADNIAAADMGLTWINDQAAANFPSAKFSVRMGSQGQAVIPGFGDTQILREVGVGGFELRNTSGSERTSGSASGEAFTFQTTTAVNEVVLRVRFPAGLYGVSKKGQIDTAKVKYRWRARLTAGPGAWSAWRVVSVDQANQSEFFSAPRTGPLGALAAPYDVQTEKVTPDSDSAIVSSRMVWDSAVEVTYAANRYAGTALLAVEVTASEQISGGIPRLSVDIEGFNDLRIWDGVSSPASPVFSRGYSENPAWIALEWMTNLTWGMGALVRDADVPMDELIDWALYCDALVDRYAPAAGQRKRFACNLVVEQPRRAIEWLRAICGVGRCVPARAGRLWRFVVARPQAVPVEVFTDRSIAVDPETNLPMLAYRREATEGGIARPNQIVARFANELRDSQPDVLKYPSDGALWLATEAPAVKTFEVVGVTDPDQVLAELVYQVKILRGLGRSIRLTPTRPVVCVQPGDRFDAAASMVGWGVASGAVRSSSSTTIKVDRTVTLIAGNSYSITVVHRDNSAETRGVTSAAGTYAAGADLTVAASWASNPIEFEEYSIGGTGVQLKPFTCTGVRWSDTENLLWEVSGIEYSDGVFNPDPAATVNLPQYSTLIDDLTPPGPVINLAAHEYDRPSGRQIELSWSQEPVDALHTASFRVYRRVVGTLKWLLVPEAKVAPRGAVVDIFDTDQGYDFAVVAVSRGGVFLSPDDPRVPKVNVVLGFFLRPPVETSGVFVTAIAGNRYRLTWQLAVYGPGDPETFPPDPVGYRVLTGGNYTAPGLPQTGLDGNQDCLVLARTVGIEPRTLDVTLPPATRCDFWVESVGPNGRLATTYLAHVSISSPALPTGQSVKLATSFTLASDGTRTNLAWNATTLRLELVNANLPGVWTSQDVDTTTITAGELAYRIGTGNDADDPAIQDVLFQAPTLEADSWGVVSNSPKLVGMVKAPNPDSLQTYLVEVRTFDGVIWSDYAPLAVFVSLARTFRKYTVRVTIKRTKEPYKPALRAFDVVVTS